MSDVPEKPVRPLGPPGLEEEPVTKKKRGRPRKPKKDE